MRLLLDTHVVLWALADDARLSDASKDRLRDAGNDVAVSAASVWEITIKRALGKLDSPPDLLTELVDSGFDTLAITPAHAVRAGKLPLHHRDPFDRMLVAQAGLEQRAFVTVDTALSAYDIEIVPA